MKFPLEEFDPKYPEDENSTVGMYCVIWELPSGQEVQSNCWHKNRAHAYKIASKKKRGRVKVGYFSGLT